MGRLQRLEGKLERAINGAFAKAFRAEVQPVEIASAVRRAMDDGVTAIAKGRTFVPTRYRIELSETDFERLTAYEEDLREELVAAAREHAESQRYQFKTELGMRFHKDAALETGVFRIVTEQQPGPRFGGGSGGRRRERTVERNDPVEDRQTARHEDPKPHPRGGEDGDHPREDVDADPDDHRGPGRPAGRDAGEPGVPPDGSDGPRSPAADRDTPAGEPSRRPPVQSPEQWWHDGTQEPDIDALTRRAPGRMPPIDDVPVERGSGRREPGGPGPVPPRLIAPADRPWLEIEGDRYPLVGPLTSLGREIGAGIVLDDANISRRHCEILVTADGPHLIARVKDLGSTNGTWVNGERATSVRLAAGDRITIGQTTLVYHAGRR